jgi:hypothetical protein
LPPVFVSDFRFDSSYRSDWIARPSPVIDHTRFTPISLNPYRSV